MTVLGDDPKNEYALAELGTVYLNRGEYAKSEELLQKSLEINDSSYSCPYEGLGLLYLQRGEEKKAKEFFSKAIRINPDVEYRKYNGLAKIFIKRKQYAKARELLRKALENYPRNQKARELLDEIDRLQEKSSTRLDIASLLAHHKDNSSDVNGIIKIAQHYQSVGDYDASDVYVLKGLAIESDNSQLYLINGWNSYHKGNLREAIKVFEQGKNYSSGIEFFYALASMYRYLADLDLANYWVREGKSLDDQSFLLCYAEGMNMFDAHRYEQARLVFEKGVGLNRSYLDNYEGVVRSYIELKDYDKAREWIERAKDVNAHNKKILNAEAMLYVKQNQYNEALDVYLKATTVSVNDVCTYHGLAHVYRQLGDLKRSEKSLGIANQSDPVHGNIKFAKYYFDSGDFSNADQFCDTIIANRDNSPYYERAFFIKGLICWYQGKDAESLAVLDKQRQSNDMRLQKTARAYCALIREDHKEALDIFHAIGTDDPEVNSFIFQGLAHAYAMLQDHARSIQYYQKVLDADAYNLWALLGLGQVYIARGNYEKAKELLERAQGVYGDNAYILSQIGMAELNSGNIKEAESLFFRSLENDSYNLSCPYEGLGLLYLSQNNAVKAEKMFKKAIAINPDEEYKKYNGLAKIYLEKQQYAQAVVLLEKSLTIRSENNEANELLRLVKLNMNG